MSWGNVGAAAVATVGSKVLGGSDSKTKTEVDFPPWLENNLQATANNLAGSPVPQLNLDELTAGMNPYIIEALAEAGNYSQGAGQGQVDAINQMGLEQAAVAKQLEGLGAMQAGYGASALDGAGSYILEQLAKSGGGSGSPSIVQSYGGGGGGGGLGGIKFEYDQDTFDKSYNNLIGAAQGAFDSWSNRTKTDNLFNNAGGVKIGSQLLGGANTKVGQNASLLDALTNQQIVDYGAQMQQYAAGTADANAMAAGSGNLQSLTSRSNAALSAATSRANAATAAASQRYGALLNAATNLYGQGAGLLNNANSSLTNAGTTYGNASATFGNANDVATTNMNTSLASGNYIQQYDQAALDRRNDGMLYNTQMPFNMNLAMYNAYNGTATGSNVTESPSFLNQFGELGSTLATMGVFPNSDIRLKENVRPLTVKDGIWIYTWDWNDKAREIGCDNQPTTGVIAQQVKKTHPAAVGIDQHGYYTVDYSQLH